MIVIKGHEVKNQPSDMTLGEYEVLMSKINQPVLDQNNLKETKNFPTERKKWANILQMQGLPKEALDQMDGDELHEAARLFNKFDSNDIQVVKEVVIGSRKYVAFDEEFSIGWEEEDKMEELTKKSKNRVNLPSEWVAVLFKDTQLSDSEHFTNAHIKHKAKLFREHMNGSTAAPYLAYIGQKFLKRRAAALQVVRDMNAQNDESTEGLDGGQG